MKRKLILILLAIIAAAAALWYGLSDRPDKFGHRAYDHTEMILSFGPRTPGSEGMQQAQHYIATELAKHGWSTMSQSLTRDTPLGKRTFTNLIARYQPDALNTLADLQKLPTLGILCAHLDSKQIPGIAEFLGADDAASACALIIELAATIAQENPDMAKQLEIVFYDGEEAFGENIIIPGYNAPREMEADGLYGSRAYSHTLYNRKPKPQFGILLDMIGHQNLKIAVPSDSPPHLYQSLLRAAKKHGHSKRYSMANHPIIDDHFYMNKAGVPTIDIIAEGFADSHWWHQEGDDLSLISPSSLTISYHVVLEMLREQWQQ